MVKGPSRSVSSLKLLKSLRRIEVIMVVSQSSTLSDCCRGADAAQDPCTARHSQMPSIALGWAGRIPRQMVVPTAMSAGHAQRERSQSELTSEGWTGTAKSTMTSKPDTEGMLGMHPQARNLHDSSLVVLGDAEATRNQSLIARSVRPKHTLPRERARRVRRGQASGPRPAVRASERPVGVARR